MYDVNIFRPILELAILLPGAIFCYIPMKNHIHNKEKIIAFCGIPILILWIMIGGIICYIKGWSTTIWLFPSLVLFALFFYKTVTLPAWKSISVFLAVCGVFSSIKNLAIVADALISPQNNPKLLTLSGGCIYFLLCCTLVASLYYPSTHAARWLLDEIEMPGTWYVFIIRPLKYSTLYTNRVIKIYPILIIALLILILFCYMMFYLMARGLGKNMRLMQENEFLQMQAAQYRILQKNMEETRIARHDLRQHLTVIQSCIDSQNWDTLNNYIKDYSKNLPSDVVHNYCKNYAVDALQTIIPEPEFCVLLGNLLENAIEACAVSIGERFIKVAIQQTGSSMLSMIVDNTSSKPPIWEKGRLVSCKHEGFGMGTESVRIITKRYHGDARFKWKDGMFYVSIMLNP